MATKRDYWDDVAAEYEDWHSVIADYERRVSSGEITFTGPFADDPPKSFEWEKDLIDSHLPEMDR
jgi:hypothetical protein